VKSSKPECTGCIVTGQAEQVLDACDHQQLTGPQGDRSAAEVLLTRELVRMTA
jgi:hypothetical protein